MAKEEADRLHADADGIDSLSPDRHSGVRAAERGSPEGATCGLIVVFKDLRGAFARSFVRVSVAPGGARLSMAQKFTSLTQRQSLANHSSRGRMPCVVQTKISIGQSCQPLCCGERTLNRSKTKQKIVGLLALTQFAKFVCQASSHIELAFPPPLPFVRNDCDTVLVKVHVPYAKVIHFNSTEASIESHHQKRLQVFAVAGANSQQPFAFFLCGDTFAGLFFGQVDERIALPERIAGDPFVLNSHGKQTPEQGQFTVYRGNRSRVVFVSVGFLSNPFLNKYRSTEAQAFVGSEIAIGHFPYPPAEVLAQNHELALNVLMASQAGFFDSVLVVLCWYCVFAFVVVGKLFEREGRTVNTSLVALVFKFVKHLLNVATRFAACAGDRLALSLAAFSFCVNPSDAGIQSAVTIPPKRSCSVAAHSYVHIYCHVSEAQQGTRLLKRLQDYPMINRSNGRKIRGNVGLLGNAKNTTHGLLISGSQVRALLGSPEFPSKLSQSTKEENLQPPILSTFRQGGCIGGSICMPHSPELIQSIITLLQKDYPADQFKYTTEQAIPGTRMMPDVLVADRAGSLCCAVEIGYTRPEKLTAYRQDLKIPDVRWYDKAGNLHGDVQEKVVRVSVETEPQGFFVGYFLTDEIPCYSDECVQSALVEAAGIDIDKYSDWHDAIDDVFKDVDAANAYHEYLPCCTALTVVTDFARVWLHFFCDKCGDSEWVSKNSLCELEVIADELRDLNGREFARVHDRRQFEGEWNDAARFADKYTGAAIRYQDGEFILENEAKQFQQAVNTLRVKAISAN